MCKAFIRNGPVVETASDLSDALGVPLIYASGSSPPSDLDDICGVDVTAMCDSCEPPVSCELNDEYDEYMIGFDKESRLKSCEDCKHVDLTKKHWSYCNFHKRTIVTWNACIKHDAK